MRVKSRRVLLAGAFLALCFLSLRIGRYMFSNDLLRNSAALTFPKRWLGFSQNPPTCPGLTDYFWKAFNRTDSELCRSKFTKAMCQSNQSSLLEIPSQCVRKDSDKATFVSKRLGCFSLSLESVLNLKLRTDRKVADCVRWCQVSALTYAIYGPGSTCACSSRRPSTSASASSAVCPTACALDPATNMQSNNPVPGCNSTVLVEVYETGALPPVVNKPVPLHELKLSMDTKPVRIVYVLVWHGRSWIQIRRLFQLIYHPRHYYYIHVDTQSNYLYQQVRQLIQRYPDNVHVTENRWDTIWGGNALLSMILSVMSELMTTLRSWQWDFLINLSGADLPIRPHNELVTYLSYHKGMIFLGSTGNRARHLEDQGLDGVFVDCDRYVWFLGFRQLPFGLVLDGGSDWLVLPHEFVEYVALSQDEILQKLLEYYKHTLLPVESFFHVVAHNTRFCSNVVVDNLRLISWDKPHGCECKHGNSVDWCGCSPVAFRGSRGLARFCDAGLPCEANHTQAAGRPAFFARKFDATIDFQVINFVITTLLGRSDDYPAWTHYLENIYSARVDTNEVSDTWRLAFQALTKQSLEALRAVDSGLRESVLASDWTSHLNVFALFNGSEQASNATVGASEAITSKPFIPYPPKIVLQFGVNVPAPTGPVALQMEVLLRTPFFGWVPDRSVEQLGVGAIVHLEVATRFDGKDQVFRNYPRLITVQDKLQLIVVWKGSEQFSDKMSIYLDLRNPMHQSCSPSTPFQLTLTRQTQRAFECKQCLVSLTPLSSVLSKNCSLMPGLWQIGARTSEADNVSWAQFYLLSSAQSDETLFLSEFTAPSSPWHRLPMENYCWVRNSVSTVLDSLADGRMCKTAVWSSYGPNAQFEPPS